MGEYIQSHTHRPSTLLKGQCSQSWKSSIHSAQSDVFKFFGGERFLVHKRPNSCTSSFFYINACNLFWKCQVMAQNFQVTKVNFSFCRVKNKNLRCHMFSFLPDFEPLLIPTNVSQMSISENICSQAHSYYKLFNQTLLLLYDPLPEYPLFATFISYSTTALWNLSGWWSFWCFLINDTELDLVGFWLVYAGTVLFGVTVRAPNHCITIRPALEQGDLLSWTDFWTVMKSTCS